MPKLLNLGSPTGASLLKFCARYWRVEATSEWQLVKHPADGHWSNDWSVTISYLGQWYTSETSDNIFTIALSCWFIYFHTLSDVSFKCSRLEDQFSYRFTGSTTAALVNTFHHITHMLEDTDFVRCIFVDYSKAFDCIDHLLLFEKLLKLHLK